MYHSYRRGRVCPLWAEAHSGQVYVTPRPWHDGDSAAEVVLIPVSLICYRKHVGRCIARPIPQASSAAAPGYDTTTISLSDRFTKGTDTDPAATVSVRTSQSSLLILINPRYPFQLETNYGIVQVFPNISIIAWKFAFVTPLATIRPPSIVFGSLAS